MPNSAVLFVVDTPNIKDGAITTSKLALESVTTQKIALGAVTATEIAYGTITSAHMSFDSNYKGTVNIPGNSSYTPAKGFYTIGSDQGNVYVSVYIVGSWKNLSSQSIDTCLYFDGSNQVIKNGNTSQVSLHYMRY